MHLDDGLDHAHPLLGKAPQATVFRIVDHP